MLYVFYCEDRENSLDARMEARPRHLDRLQQLQNEGRLVVAGPCPAIDSNDPGLNGFSGSVIIAEFDALETAEAWINQDPYVEAGVFSKITVKPFKKVFPQ